MAAPLVLLPFVIYIHVWHCKMGLGVQLGALVLMLTCVFVYSTGSARKAGAGIEGSFLLQGPPDLIKQVGPAVPAKIGGKGGGRPGRMQGKGSALQHAEETRHILEDAVAPKQRPQ